MLRCRITERLFMMIIGATTSLFDRKFSRRHTELAKMKHRSPYLNDCIEIHDHWIQFDDVELKLKKTNDFFGISLFF